jgi:CCR4-NOT transcription complex subunit 6
MSWSEIKHDVPANAPLIKVISWNILAQCYALQTCTNSLPPSYLLWPERGARVVEELLACEADIFCLQEVDKFEEFYKDKMLEAGYDLVYFQRPGKKEDGCLVGWKRNVLEPAADIKTYRPSMFRVGSGAVWKYSAKEQIDEGGLTGGFQGFVDFNDFVKRQNMGLQQRCLRNNVGLFVFLRHISSGRVVIPVSIHLYWNPRYEDVKLRQIIYLFFRLSKARQFFCELQQSSLPRNEVRNSFASSGSDNAHLSSPEILLCGDFNSLPHSVVEVFVRTGAYHPSEEGVNSNKIIVDTGLNKVARWLRALGVDCAYVDVQKEVYTCFFYFHSYTTHFHSYTSHTGTGPRVFVRPRHSRKPTVDYA